MRKALAIPLRIVVTGAGAPGIRGTLFSLKNNPDAHPVHIIGTDMNPSFVGRHFVHESAVLPAPEDRAYVGELLAVARKADAHVVLPQTTREVLALSRAVECFAAEGIAVAVSHAPHTEQADSKWNLLKQCEAAGIPAPRAILSTSAREFLDAATALGHPDVPIVAKLPHSNGMRGLRVIVEDAWDVPRFIRDKPSGTEIGLDAFMDMLGKGGPWPELLVTEFLPGREYTVDVFRGLEGSAAVVRLRRTIRSGITFEAEVLPESPLTVLSCALGDHLALRFAFGFQWKEDEQGVPRILECNPRAQGTMVASTLAGVNIIWLAVREALGVGPSRAELRALRPQPISFERFWGGGAVRDGRFLET